MQIHTANEEVPKGRMIYGLYMVEGHNTLIIKGPMKYSANGIIFGNTHQEGEEEQLPIGFVMANEMMKLINENMTVSLSTLISIGKYQSWPWYKQKEA